MSEGDAVDWHGWRFGSGWTGERLVVHIGPLPRRRQFALSVEVAGTVTPLAYFVNEECARKAQAIFDGILDRMKALEKAT